MIYVIKGWPFTQIEVSQGMRLHWAFRGGLVIIEEVAMKNRGIKMPPIQALKQVHMHHLGVKKTKNSYTVST